MNLSEQSVSVPETETASLQKQMEKLHQLEQILQSSDSISPITLGKSIYAIVCVNLPQSGPG